MEMVLSSIYQWQTLWMPNIRHKCTKYSPVPQSTRQLLKHSHKQLISDWQKNMKIRLSSSKSLVGFFIVDGTSSPSHLAPVCHSVDSKAPIKGNSYVFLSFCPGGSFILLCKVTWSHFSHFQIWFCLSCFWTVFHWKTLISYCSL